MIFSKNSYWLKSGVFTILERFAVMIFGFGGFFFLVRVFSKEEFGIWALFLTVTSFVEVARNGLIQNAQVKYLASTEEEEHPKIMTASLTLNCVLTCVSAIALILFAELLSLEWKAPQLRPMFYFYIFTTIALIPFSQFNNIQQANLDFKGIFFSSFVRQGSFFTYILLSSVIGFKLDLINLVHFQTVSALLGAAVSFFFVRKFLSLTKIDWTWVSKLFHFGKYVFGTNISSMIFKTMDQMMLGSLMTTGSVATYNTAVRITNLVEVPTTSVANIVFPQSAKRIKTEGKDAVKYLYEKSVGVILALIIPGLLFVMLFPEFVILLIAGEKYLDTVPILQITILYSVFVPFGRQFGIVLDSIGKPKINFYLILLSAVFTFVFNYMFIKLFGVIGAAYASLLTYSISFCIMQFILYKELNIRIANVFIYIWKFYLDVFSGLKGFFKKKLVTGKL